MQNYKDPNNKVHVLEDAAFEHLLPPGCVRITEEDAKALNSPEFSALKSDLVFRIDSDADSIYAAALGNRETEYKQAEDEASAYRTANYSGDVPPYVQAWVSAKKKTAQWAADDIISTAAAWRTAQSAIRTNRLACKEAARSATTADELAPIVAQWNAFVVAIKSQLGAV